ncbi:MAG: CvpA family protein [Clostridia bacterium]|nr:CvpA family protein [Clostridia bacterium]
MTIALSALLDLGMVAILGFSIFFGIRRGLIRSVIRLVGSIVALVVALSFSAPLGSYIDENYVNAPMREWAIDQLSSSVESVSATDVNFDDLFADRPSFFVETCEFLGVNVDEMQASYESLKTDGVEQAKSAIITQMVDPLSAIVSRGIAFAVLFIAAMIAILVISLFSRFLNNLPIIKNVDKLGGGILGAVTGILMCFIVVAIISTASQYVLKDQTPEDRTAIRENTIVYKLFYNLDPLTGLFETTD